MKQNKCRVNKNEMITYKAKLVWVMLVLDVIQQGSIRHKVRDKRESIGGDDDTAEG